MILSLRLFLLSSCLIQGIAGEDKVPNHSLRGRKGNQAIVEEDRFLEPIGDGIGFDNAENRIVGGEQSDPGEFPYYVELLFRNSDSHYCGGTLIAPRVVLTAAHCEQNYVGQNVLVGGYEVAVSNDHGTQAIRVDAQQAHPDYNDSTLANDFLLLRLEADAKVATPRASISRAGGEDDPAAGTTLRVIGLGDLSSGGSSPNILRDVNVPVVDADTCDDLYRSGGSSIEKDVMFCAGDINDGGEDSCQGDSGGPIVIEQSTEVHELVGVVSWGFGCADRQFPGVYAKVGARNSWIAGVVCNEWGLRADFCAGGGNRTRTLIEEDRDTIHHVSEEEEEEETHRLNEEAVDLPLKWTYDVEDFVGEENLDQFVINPSIMFVDNEDGGVDLVRAARLHGYHNSFVRDENGETLEKIFNYHSSILIQSEPFLGNLSAPFGAKGMLEWGLDGKKPLKPVDGTLRSTDGHEWNDLCESKPKIKGSKLIRKQVFGPEDPKLTMFPDSKWGVSYSSYPLKSQVANCKWSDESVFRMHLAPEGAALASGEAATGFHLDCGYPKTQDEKNWIPFVYEDSLYYIKSLDPLIVVRAHPDEGTCEQVYESSSDVLNHISDRFQVRGNANAVRYSDSEYLAVLHTHDENDKTPGAGYTSRAFKFEATPPFRITAVSKPLPLFKDRGAFVSSLTIHSGKIIVGYGVFDQLSRALVMTKEYMEKLFDEAYLSDEYGMAMEEMSLDRSFGHQKKFLSKKESVVDVFSREARFSAFAGKFGSVALTDEFAYLHVWKSGGTSVQLQPGTSNQLPISHPAIADKDMLTFVRDPIDHFLSGWAEAGVRLLEVSGNADVPKWDEATYDDRIRQYLEEVKTKAFGSNKPKMSAYTHSFPQANFLIKKDGSMNSQVKIIGDIDDMAEVMELVGFEHRPDIHGRKAAEDSVKSGYFPARKDLISDETMLKICEFVAIDYYLFDFEPPSACAGAGSPLDF